MKILFAFISACHQSRREHFLKKFATMRTFEKWGLKFDWQIVLGHPDSQPKNDLWLPRNQSQLTPHLDEHLLEFNVDDTRRWMTIKNQELFKWALEHEYDFVFRSCDDSIVFPHRLLAHKIAFQHDYFGTMCGYGQIAGVQGAFVLRYLDYMHGGVGIGLSRKAMERLVADVYPGPDHSPYGNSNEIDILPNHAVRGGWGTYWDDLWIGEVLKGHLAYSAEERNNTYYNYSENGIEVYDNPKLFSSNLPIDFKNVIAHHSLAQMGKTNLTPGPFSTKFSSSVKLEIPWQHIEPKFNLHEPEHNQ